MVAHYQRNIPSHCTSCESCQRRKNPHRRPPLPKGHVPVEWSFQRVAIDLVEYKTISQECKYVVSVIDDFTRSVILTPIRDKTATAIARVVVDRVLSVFGVPEMLHSDRGT